jgi:hypothetical protein
VSPVPNVRGQAIVLTILLIATAGLGAAWEAGALATGLAVGGFALRWKYLHDLGRTPSVLPPHRERLDLLVTADLRMATLLGLALPATLLLAGVGAPGGVGTIRSVVVTLAVTVLVIYLSSLVDWYVILPRISGQLGARPCRSHLARQKPGPWPRTWRETTQWWYIHRLVAAVVFRFGLSYALALAISGVVTYTVDLRIVTIGALALFAEYSPLRLAPVAREAMHPQLFVGRTVHRVRRERQVRWEKRIGSVTLFALHRKTPEPEFTSKREYVYDVAAEGVQLVPVGPREAEPAPEDFEREPLRIRLKDVDEVAPGEPPFTGCEGRCSGINWYCIENVRCFETK